MAISNNISMTNIPINSGNVTQIKKNDNKSNVDALATVQEKVTNSEFSLVLSSQQQENINDTIGYDQPTAKDRGALDAYKQVATQQKRDEIIDSMSFHFVV